MKTTHLLIVLNLLIYAAMLGVAGGGQVRAFSLGTLTEFGALNAELVRRGEWWRLATMMFIHLTPLHLAMNMLALWQAGGLLETHFGRGRFTALYLLAGLAGSAASFAWGLRHPVTSAGASGAISGLIGAGVVAGQLAGGPIGLKLRDSMIRWAMLILVFGLVAGADNAAHAGGFVAGSSLAWAFDRGARTRRPSGGGVGVEALLLVGLVGASFGLAGRAHQRRAADYEREEALVEAVRAGVEHGTAGRFVEAAAEYRKALALDPENAIARFDLGFTLLRLKDYPGAAAEERAALKIDPTLADAWAVLADVYTAQGRPAEADAALKHFLELGGRLARPDGGAPD